MEQAKEKQNRIQFLNYTNKGGFILGPFTSHIWRTDPRHLSFLLARYKFCSKMLHNKTNILEIGCGDSFGSSIILQEVKSIHSIDIEPLVIKEAIKRNENPNTCSYQLHDITKTPLKTKFDGAFSLDVIEHISKNLEDLFVENITKSLNKNGILLLGTPNITASQYASEASLLGHINLQSFESLFSLLEKSFENVFMFSMNDEVVHTGFYPMAHYLICMGVGVK